MASADALPPNTVSRWLMFGASGAASTAASLPISRTETCIAFESGI
jgi:hypothetical protein